MIPPLRTLAALGTVFIGLLGCSFQSPSKYNGEAEKAAKAGEWELALEYYEKEIKVNLESKSALVAARAAARIAATETRDYPRLTGFLRYTVLHTQEQDERIAAQKLLAETYFEKIGDYKNAVTELNRALEYIASGKDSDDLRLMLARAHFFLNDFFQAKSEIEFALKDNHDPEFQFKSSLLKANILFNEKKLEEAIQMYQSVLADFPQRAAEEEVALSLAVCFEEKEDFARAIEVLQKMAETDKNRELVGLKIKRLRERQAQAPGAKGLRK